MNYFKFFLIHIHSNPLQKRALITCDGPLNLGLLGNKGLLNTGLLKVDSCSRENDKLDENNQLKTSDVQLDENNQLKTSDVQLGENKHIQKNIKLKTSDVPLTSIKDSNPVISTNKPINLDFKPSSKSKQFSKMSNIHT